MTTGPAPWRPWRPWRAGVGIIVAATVGSLAFPALPGDKTVPQTREEVELSYAPVVRKVAPSVVNIYARKQAERSRSPIFDDPVFRRFFGEEFGFGVPSARIENSLGSGVVVDESGLIVTNNHVVGGADEITVVLSDRREFGAEVVLTDKRTDLAVLRIDAGGEKLPALEFRDSDDLEVGDLVLAIGNPFGVGQTVTSGIVSALARNGIGVTDFQFFIQTDAAINPGNSGGPLVTLDGRIAGINTAIYSRSGGSNGVGFAVPSNMARAVVYGAAHGGVVRRPWLGAAGQALSREIAQSLDLPRPMGVLINEVHAGGPAARAGLKVGDVVLAVDGREVEDPPSLLYRIGTHTVGGKLRLTLLREGRKLDISVDLQPAPENPPRNVTELEGTHPIAGATVGNLSPAFAEELGIHSVAKGVIILRIANGSPAHRLRLRPGDLVLTINGSPVETVGDLRQALRVSAGGEWRITLRRGDQKLNLVVRG